MDDDLHDIDDLFYNELEPKLQLPSYKVWDGINKRLNEDNNNKRPAFITSKRMLAIFAIFFAAFSAIIGYHRYQKKYGDEQNKIATDQNPRSLDTLKPIGHLTTMILL